MDEYNTMMRRKQTADAARPPQDTLGTFVRSLTGLSEEAARAAFAEFLDTALYNEEQIALRVVVARMLLGQVDVHIGAPILIRRDIAEQKQEMGKGFPI